MLQKLSEFTSKEMDRKEFLQNAGIGVLLLVGGGAIARAFDLGLSDRKSQSQSDSYGDSSYGG